jgi:hypothetical protein
MIFQPTEARAALYRRLLTDTLLVRSQTPTGERGHSFLFAAANAVVRDRADDEDIYESARAFGDEIRANLALGGVPSIIPENGRNETVLALVRQMWQTGRFKSMLFEGYVANSAREHAPFFELLDQEFSAQGAIVLRANGAVTDRWNDKTRFTDYMKELHGPEAIPPGVTVPVTPLAGIVAATRDQLALGGRAILKVAGMGGSGNLIVSSDEGEARIEERIAAFVSEQSHAQAVRVEAWQPWRASVCCSFFVTETSDAIPMEMCSQVLSQATAGFLGSSSQTPLTLTDRLALQEMILPFVRQAAADGMRGFLGIDVILSDASGRPHERLLPDSGLAVRFVETNMRVNSHNQDRLFIAQFAACHGVDFDRMDHLKVGARVDAPSRQEALPLIGSALSGVSVPFGPQFEPGRLYYLVIECHGAARASRNDCVLFFGEGISAETFATATARLQQQGLLKS